MTTEIEKSYIAESPGGLWPTNEDSDFGFHRTVFCEQLDDAIQQLQLLYNERFPDTAQNYLSYFEEMLDLPASPGNKTIDERRVLVSSRLRRGLFTRTLRASIIEAFITATFGIAPAFGPLGIPLTGSGIPLYSGFSGDPKQYYSITENITNFSYRVGINYQITVDQPALIRELKRITPGHISFTLGIDYPKTGGIQSPRVIDGSHS